MMLPVGSSLICGAVLYIRELLDLLQENGWRCLSMPTRKKLEPIPVCGELDRAEKVLYFQPKDLAINRLYMLFAASRPK